MSGDVHVRFCERLEGWFLWATLLVIMHEDKTVIEGCREIISEWFKGIGLELKPEKTRLTHTLNCGLSEDGNAGFDFL